MGNLVRLIPISIVIGFTAGIAIIIGISQVKDLLGLDIPKPQSNFFLQIAMIGERIHTFNWQALVVGLASLATIVFWPTPKSAGSLLSAQSVRWRVITAKLPSTIVVLVLSSLVVWSLNLPVETIGSKFGELPRGLPIPHFPAFDWETARNLVAPSIAIALLCAIESLLCARVADALINDRHDANQELMAQGVANFCTPFFGGIAATGTIARTMTNVRSGARSPVAGIVHAVTLLLIIVVAAPLAGLIPLAALAAILLWVAYSMAEWGEFAKLRQYSMFYRITMLSTFFLTVIFDLVVAVEVGLILASLFFIYRMSSLTRVDTIALPLEQSRLPDGRVVGAVRIFGALFFGSVTKLERLLDPNAKLPDVLILEMHQTINMDNSGLDALESLQKLITRRGGLMMIAGANEQPLMLMKRSGFVKLLGEDNLRASLEDALHIVGAPRESRVET